MKIPALPSYLKEVLDKYKYILLVCLVGVLLMIWPQNSQAPGEGETVTPSEPQLLETRLQSLLEAMDGVGRARVLLTVAVSEETAYAYDRTESQNQSDGGGSRSRQTELVTVPKGSGQSPVPLYTAAPDYRGAVVVCDGAGSAAVRLAVTQVVQSLTGISADRIVISKMK